LDFPYTENVPAEITLDISTENELLSWSPDGHYLLFDSSQTGTKKLSVWDGKVISDIYNYHEKVADVVWSSNGQLAFTDFYTFVSPHDGDSSEVFIWDGKDIVSVSQNPSGVDRSPTWNKENQLAFLSERNGEYDIFVWNGVSKNNGVPDINTFLNIAPSLTQYFSNPTWTNSGSLAFSGNGTWDLNVQIYEWDGQIARNISKNPLSHNGGQTWRNDGYWSFITFFSESQNLYIRDEINQTVVKTKGQYKPAWSQNGLLMFCVPDPQDWTLSIWNGKNVVEVAHGYFIVAKWNNGEYVFCSNG
jgi:Tol biopolymer transport system component